MKIKLKKLIIKNFKGITQREISFAEENFIIGKNGSGKTSIFDAFTWVLFGKDSYDSTKFKIKPKDAIRPEIEVSCLLDVDGTEQKFTRILKEKWVKKRGEEIETFEGNETILMVNDIVYKTNEYQKYISDIISEDLFKMLTSATIFMGLKWEKRREMLYSLVPEVSESEVASTNEEFKKLVDFLKGTPIEKYIAELKAKISSTKKELSDIPTRINELQQNIPTEVISFEGLRCELAMLEDQSKQNDKIASKRKEIEAKIASERTAHENRYKKQLEEKQSQENLKFQAKSKLQEVQNKYYIKEREITALRDEYSIKSVLKYVAGICPISKLVCNVDGVFQGEADFNSKKASDLKEINDKGKALKSEIESLKSEIAELEQQHDSIVVPQVEYTSYDDTKLRATMPEYEAENPRIKEIQMLLGKEEYANQLNARLEELRKKEREVSESLAKLERTEIVCEKFIKQKAEISVEKINKLFSFVTWQLYEKQINGGENPVCECFVDGVPFNTVNTAARISAGIDIINVLSKFNDIYCPVFIDNMESCHDPIECVSQTIYLVVDKNEKQLIIK